MQQFYWLPFSSAAGLLEDGPIAASSKKMAPNTKNWLFSDAQG